jgi:small subunit ribosomal protein S16
MGAKKRPFYRVVVADARSPRDGRFIESVGYYDPLKNPKVFHVDNERILHWMATGARPSDAVRELLEREGTLPKTAHPVRTKTGPKRAPKPAQVPTAATAAAASPEPAVEALVDGEPAAPEAGGEVVDEAPEATESADGAAESEPAASESDEQVGQAEPAVVNDGDEASTEASEESAAESPEADAAASDADAIGEG